MPDLRDAVRHLCPDWAVDSIETFDYLPGGYSNDNYAFTCDGERYVFGSDMLHGSSIFL